MSKDKRMILGNAFDAFERLDLSKVQSINFEMVEYDDVTNKLALEVIYSPEVENNKEYHIHTGSIKAPKLSMDINGKVIAGCILDKSGDARI